MAGINIADLIMNQMQQAGKPRTTTTTMTQPDEPLDLGSLGMLLYFMLNKNKAKTTPIGPLVGMGSAGVGAGATGAGGMDPIQLLLSLLAGVGGAGGGGMSAMQGARFGLGGF